LALPFLLAAALTTSPALADEAVEQAIVLFREHKPARASTELHALLEGPDLEDADRARYYLARSLHNLGLVQAAQLELLALMERDGPYARHALSGLLAIARQTGDPSALIGVVDRVDPAEHPPAVQPSLHYLQGLGAWQRQDHVRANELLGQVPEGSALYPRARYLQGLILTQHGKDKSAVGAFEDVVEAAPHSDDRRAHAQLAALATLQIGRVYDTLGALDKAEGFYAQVERGSTPWADALEAMARIDLAQGEPDSALRRSLSASWPVLSSAAPRGAELLHAQALAALCRPDEAQVVLRSFDERALPMWTELAGLTAAHRDDEGTWRDPREAWLAWNAPRDEGWDLSTPIVELTLLDHELAEAVRRVRGLDDKLRLVSAQDVAWREAMGPVVRTRLEAEREDRQAEAGLVLLEALASMEAELGVLLTLSEAQRSAMAEVEGCPAAAAGGPQDDPDAWDSEQRDEPPVWSWPFTGEIWADEI